MVSGLEVSVTQDIIVPEFFPFREDTEGTGLSPILPLDQKERILSDDTSNGIKMRLLLFSINKIPTSKWTIVNKNIIVSTQTLSDELRPSLIYIKSLEFLDRGLMITGASMLMIGVSLTAGIATVDYLPNILPSPYVVSVTAAILSIFLAFLIERYRLVNR